MSNIDLEVIQVIRTRHVRGDGKETVLREVTTLWSIDGKRIVEIDPVNSLRDEARRDAWERDHAKVEPPQ